MASNDPKILVELSPEELAWLADRLHEEWGRTLNAKAVATGDNVAKVEKHQKMQNTIRLRLLKNAVDQGFGDL